MRAIGYTTAGPASTLTEVDIETPQPGPHDLLVEVRGISVNPVDVKVRANHPPDGAPRVLGFDAAGVVVSVGDAVSRFRPGDAVFYAGDITRPGTNAAYHVVDERIVGRKPTTLDFVDAAALPLTSITAWEILFDSFGFIEGGGAGEALLIIGGAGGVGSILIQLAKALTKLTVIATASRPETVAWVQQMGADHVINHRGSLVEQLAALEIVPRYVASLTHTAQHMPAILNLIQPRGHIVVIDDPASLDVKPMKTKALTVSWEFMFTRPMFQTADLETQHHLLNRIADLIDAGTIVSTVQERAGELSAETLISAHERQESGRSIGKTVLSGFPSNSFNP